MVSTPSEAAQKAVKLVNDVGYFPTTHEFINSGPEAAAVAGKLILPPGFVRHALSPGIGGALACFVKGRIGYPTGNLRDGPGYKAQMDQYWTKYHPDFAPAAFPNEVMAEITQALAEKGKDRSALFTPGRAAVGTYLFKKLIKVLGTTWETVQSTLVKPKPAGKYDVHPSAVICLFLVPYLNMKDPKLTMEPAILNASSVDEIFSKRDKAVKGANIAAVQNFKGLNVKVLLMEASKAHKIDSKKAVDLIFYDDGKSGCSPTFWQLRKDFFTTIRTLSKFKSDTGALETRLRRDLTAAIENLRVAEKKARTERGVQVPFADAEVECFVEEAKEQHAFNADLDSANIQPVSTRAVTLRINETLKKAGSPLRRIPKQIQSFRSKHRHLLALKAYENNLPFELMHSHKRLLGMNLEKVKQMASRKDADTEDTAWESFEFLEDLDDNDQDGAESMDTAGPSFSQKKTLSSVTGGTSSVSSKPSKAGRLTAEGAGGFSGPLIVTAFDSSKPMKTGGVSNAGGSQRAKPTLKKKKLVIIVSDDEDSSNEAEQPAAVISIGIASNHTENKDRVASPSSKPFQSASMLSTLAAKQPKVLSNAPSKPSPPAMANLMKRKFEEPVPEAIEATKKPRLVTGLKPAIDYLKHIPNDPHPTPNKFDRRTKAGKINSIQHGVQQKKLSNFFSPHQ